MRMRLIAPTVLLLLAGACHDGGAPAPKEVVDPEPAAAPAQPADVAEPEDPPEVAEPRVEPVPPGIARASIAAVRMTLENCPEPPASARVDAARGLGQRSIQDRPAGDSPGDSDRPSCAQSTIQFAFLGQGDAPGRVVLQSLTVFAAGVPTPAGTVRARDPSAWNDDGQYAPWDEIIPAKSDLNASYTMSDPTWFPNAATGTPYVLEVVLTIDGVSQTVRSAEFVPEPVQVMVT